MKMQFIPKIACDLLKAFLGGWLEFFLYAAEVALFAYAKVVICQQVYMLDTDFAIKLTGFTYDFLAVVYTLN